MKSLESVNKIKQHRCHFDFNYSFKEDFDIIEKDLNKLKKVESLLDWYRVTYEGRKVQHYLPWVYQNIEKLEKELKEK